jgi:hypothetical protein
MECGDRGPPGRRPSHDPLTSGRPPKVLAPDLTPRIEQADEFAAQGIRRNDSIGFVIVAQRTGKSQIILFGQPTR